MTKSLMWRKLGGKFDVLYCPDMRRWSLSDYVVWVAVSTDCNLGCRHCHEHGSATVSYLDAGDLERISDEIKVLEGRSRVKLHITPTLGDMFLSPHLIGILDWAGKNGHVMNLCSYFPIGVDIGCVRKLVENYNESVCLCCSLHGYTDAQRAEQFDRPHAIDKLLPLLNARNRYLNTVYIFSTIRPMGHVLSSLKPENVVVTLLSLIDYRSNMVYSGNFPTEYGRLKRFVPRSEVLELINGRSFEYVCTDQCEIS